MSFPIVLLTITQATRVAAGHPMMCSDLDGNAVMVRLASVDELLDGNRKSIAIVFPNGDGPDPMSRAQAVRLTTPIGGAVA